MTQPPADSGYRVLSWDSEFFGIRIAQIDAGAFTEGNRSECLQWCHDQRIECAYLSVNSADQGLIDAAVQNEFRLVDIRLILKTTTTTAEHRQHPAGVEIRASRDSDIDALSNIAIGAHRDTRFYVDGGFDRARCDALYELWIAKSCRGWADHVVVAERAGEAVGYVTCHRTQTAGRIGLVGVAESARGLGIGHAMIGEALRWCSSQDLDEVTVATQGRNMAALNLYQKSGFSVATVDCIFHKWFAEAADR